MHKAATALYHFLAVNDESIFVRPVAAGIKLPAVLRAKLEWCRTLPSQGLEEAKRLLPRQLAEEDVVTAHAALNAAVRSADEASSERRASLAPPAGALLLAEAAAERGAIPAREAVIRYVEVHILAMAPNFRRP